MIECDLVILTALPYCFCFNHMLSLKKKICILVNTDVHHGDFATQGHY